MWSIIIALGCSVRKGIASGCCDLCISVLLMSEVFTFPTLLGYAFAQDTLLLCFCGKLRALQMEMTIQSCCHTSSGNWSDLWCSELLHCECLRWVGWPGSCRFVTGFADEQYWSRWGLMQCLRCGSHLNRDSITAEENSTEKSFLI